MEKGFANKKMKHRRGELGEAGQFLHGLHLLGLEAAVAADLEIPQFENPESRADQVNDSAFHGFNHAPDQALPPARHGDPQVGQITAPSNEVYLPRSAEPVFQVHAAAESLKRRFRHLALHGDLVSLGNVKTGVGQAVGPFAVVGEKQQTQAVKIQAAHGVDPFLGPCEQIGHHGPPFWITEGAHVPERLVQHEVESVRGGRNRPSVHPDVIDSPDCLGAGLP